MRAGCVTGFVALLATAALADPPLIEKIDGDGSQGTLTLDVTLRHPDTGTDHYANAWRVEAGDGTILATRELLHPHVDEQPFTRSLAGIPMTADMSSVFVRASCSLTGWSENRVEYPLQ